MVQVPPPRCWYSVDQGASPVWCRFHHQGAGLVWCRFHHQGASLVWCRFHHQGVGLVWCRFHHQGAGLVWCRSTIVVVNCLPSVAFRNARCVDWVIESKKKKKIGRSGVGIQGLSHHSSKFGYLLSGKCQFSVRAHSIGLAYRSEGSEHVAKTLISSCHEITWRIFPVLTLQEQ